MKKIKIWQIILIILLIIAIIVGIVIVVKKSIENKERFEMEEKALKGKKPAITGNLLEDFSKAYYMNTSNEKINEIYNTAIKKMFNKHTIIINNKKTDYCEKFDNINKIAYLKQPLVNSDGEVEIVFNKYEVFLEDYVTNYIFNEEVNKWDLSITDCYYPFNILFLDYDEEEYDFELIEDNNMYTIKARDDDEDYTKTIYINKTNLLITKIEIDDSMYEAEYTNEKIEIPQEAIDLANYYIEKHNL